MTAARLPKDESACLGDRLESLDSPIARIGLHLLEDLGRAAHNTMILQVTLLCNVKFGGKDPSFDGAAAEPQPGDVRGAARTASGVPAPAA